LSSFLRARIDGLVAGNPYVHRDPVDANPEGGAGTEEATMEGVEGVEEVLTRLRFGSGEGDSGLTIGEDVDAGESCPLDDIQGQDGAGDLGLEDRVFAGGPKVLRPARHFLLPVQRYRRCSDPPLVP
jgi:hypothetical protein